MLPIELQRVGAAPVVVIPGDEAVGQRVAEQLVRRLEPQGTKLRATVGRSRPAANVEDLVRARDEALLAANVAFAGGSALLAFEETGSYRLLLPAMTTDVGELERFYEETVAPLMAYDRQYETELVRTVRGVPGERRETSPAPRRRCSPTATPSATGSSASASSPGWMSAPAMAVSGSHSA